MKNAFKDLSKKFLKIWPVTITALSIGIYQFVVAKGWLTAKGGKVGSYKNFGLLIVILCLVISLTWLYNSRIASFKKLKVITPLDIFLYGLILSLIINEVLLSQHGINIYFKYQFLSLKRIMIVFAIGAIGCLSFRLHRISEGNNNKVLGIELKDFKSLYNGKVDSEKGDAILVDERDVDYDLFKRSVVRDELVRALQVYSSKHAYVIGLVGKWGTGKTTLLNGVKKYFERKNGKSDSDPIFMHAPGKENEDFDIWLFGSKNELIKGLYDTFLSNLGIHYNSSFNSFLLNNISRIIAGLPQVGGILAPLVSSKESYKDINDIKQKLSSYIMDSNKHYVLCIENLDRTSSDQVVLLLKLISSIFDLPNVTYVLLYDKDRLNRIVNNSEDLDASYEEKVINQEIAIPVEINSQVCKRILQNLLLSYGILQEDLSQYDHILETIVNNLSSIRELKRIINSVFTILSIKDYLRLNLPQVIAIQYLYYSCRDLYDEIRENQEIFISNDKNLDEKSEALFLDLEKKYSKYVELVQYLFPKFNNYVYKKVTGTKGVIRDYSLREKESRDALINVSNFFECYFALSENNYVKINAMTRDFLKKIKSGENIRLAWKEYMLDNDTGTQEQFSLELQKFVFKDDIPKSEIREELAVEIIKSIDRKELEGEVLTYRSIGVVARLIGEITNADFQKFKKIIERSPNKVLLGEKLKDSMEANSLGGVTNRFIRNQKRIENLLRKFNTK